MKITKISAHELKIEVTRKELEIRKIYLEDMVASSEPLKKFVQEVIEEAGHTENFRVGGGPVEVNVLKTGDEETVFIMIKDKSEASIGKNRVDGVGENEESMMNFMKNLARFLKNNSEEPEANPQKRKVTRLAIEFCDMDAIAASCIMELPDDYPALLFKAKEGKLILVLGRSRKHKADLDSIRYRIGDYGNVVGTTEDEAKSAFYGKTPMIKTNVIGALRTIYGISPKGEEEHEDD